MIWSRPESTVKALSMAAHRVTAPTIAARLDISLARAEAHVAEYQRWRVRKYEAPQLIAECMSRLGITGREDDEPAETGGVAEDGASPEIDQKCVGPGHWFIEGFEVTKVGVRSWQGENLGTVLRGKSLKIVRAAILDLLAER